MALTERMRAGMVKTMAATPAPAPTDPRASLLAEFIDWLDEQGARVHVSGIYGCEPTSCNTPMPDLIAEFLTAQQSAEEGPRD